MTTEERILELVRERDQAAQEAVDLKTRIAELERILADPASVWANMLTGKIARPQALDHYEECKAIVEKLEEQVRVLRVELNLIAHLNPSPGGTGAIARKALAVTEGLDNGRDELREDARQ
jgi:hypothetical protein